MFITIEGANPYVYMMWSTGAMFNLNKDPNNLTLNSTMSLVIWVIQQHPSGSQLTTLRFI